MAYFYTKSISFYLLNNVQLLLGGRLSTIKLSLYRITDLACRVNILSYVMVLY